MKIAIIHPDFNTKGGAENVIYWLCEELSKKNDLEIVLFSVNFADMKEKFKNIKGLQVKEIYIPKVLRNNQLGRLIFATFYLKKYLRNYNIINPHNYPASLWVGIANLLSGKKLPKIVWSCNEPTRFLYRKITNKHTPENLQVLHSELDENLNIKLKSKIKFIIKSIYKPILRYIDKKAIKTFSKTLTLSNAVAEQIKKIYRIKNVFTCYMGVKDIGQQDIVGWNKGYFITVSRLESCKNIQNVIKAFALIKELGRLKDMKYFIIGNGPMESYLKNMIIENNLSDSIIMLGYISREELVNHYKNCLCILYLPFDEPFGLPYLEAAVFSKPAIASNHGGPSELVVDGKTGLLADPSNIREISEKIEKVFQNKIMAEEMGNNANKYIKDNFTWGKYIDRYLGYMQ